MSAAERSTNAVLFDTSAGTLTHTNVPVLLGAVWRAVSGAYEAEPSVSSDAREMEMRRAPKIVISPPLIYQRR